MLANLKYSQCRIIVKYHGTIGFRIFDPTGHAIGSTEATFFSMSQSRKRWTSDAWLRTILNFFSFINMVVTSGEKRGRHTKKGPGLACASAWVTCKIDRLVGCDGKSCRRLPENMAGASMEPWPLRWWSYLPIALVRSAHKIIKQQPSGQSWSFRELIPSPVKSLLKKSCLNPRKI